ncbi:MAG: tRNA lysidine(34) synthetase TilS [Saprospiraceae bacterium]
MVVKLLAFQAALLKAIPANLESPKFLLAVSGGLDSMVLTDLFSRCDWSFGIAHCNFQLRGEASNEDAIFVQKKAQALRVNFHVTNFKTKTYAALNKLSTQEAARKLRYEWLEEIRSKNNYDYLITAHHLDDSLETFLFNFAKGSGLKGLLGIPAKNGPILRPLLGFSRAELEIYYSRKKLNHREDASNSSDDYDRNKIRHQVIPVLKDINPALLTSVAANLEHLKDSYLLFQHQVKQLEQQILVKNDDQILIQSSLLMAHPARRTLLYEWLKPQAFHPNQIPQILDCIVREKTGAIFYASKHRLLVNRDQLLVEPIPLNENLVFQLETYPQTITLPEGDLIIEKIKVPPIFQNNPYIAYLAIAPLAFPLIIRRWQAGDQFCPLGMQGQHKKVQDLLSDLKINRFEKDRIWIVENGNKEICWVMGMRLDDRYKVYPSDEYCLQLSFQKRNLSN